MKITDILPSTTGDGHEILSLVTNNRTFVLRAKDPSQKSAIRALHSAVLQAQNDNTAGVTENLTVSSCCPPQLLLAGGTVEECIPVERRGTASKPAGKRRATPPGRSPKDTTPAAPRQFVCSCCGTPGHYASTCATKGHPCLHGVAPEDHPTFFYACKYCGEVKPTRRYVSDGCQANRKLTIRCQCRPGGRQHGKWHRLCPLQPALAADVEPAAVAAYLSNIAKHQPKPCHSWDARFEVVWCAYCKTIYKEKIGADFQELNELDLDEFDFSESFQIASHTSQNQKGIEGQTGSSGTPKQNEATTASMEITSWRSSHPDILPFTRTACSPAPRSSSVLVFPDSPHSAMSCSTSSLDCRCGEEANNDDQLLIDQP